MQKCLLESFKFAKIELTIFFYLQNDLRQNFKILQIVGNVLGLSKF